MRKKVLIISYSYPPSNVPAAQRPYTVAKYLNKEDYEVTVITCGNADVSWGVNEGFDPQLPQVNLIRINSLLGRGASALKRSKTIRKQSFKDKIKSSIFTIMSSMVVPDQAIFWYPKVRKYLLKNKDLIYNTDLVFTTSPSFSNHLVGMFIKSVNSNISWVTELRDFHFIETSERVSNLKQVINRKLELSIIKKSDKVSFISYAMLEIYTTYYNKYSKKFGVIYNGFDIADFEYIQKPRTNNEKLTIFYAGSFYRGVRSPIPLLKILDGLIEKGRIGTDEIEIRIAGNFENELLDEVKKCSSYVSINFIGNIPRKEVLRHMVSADLLWLIVGNKSTHYTGVPIKFFEYLGARRPIVNFAPAKSEPTRIVSDNNLGWNFDTSDFNIVKSVKEFEEIISAYRSGELRENLAEGFLPQFDREYQGVLFGDLFKKTIPYSNL